MTEHPVDHRGRSRPLYSRRSGSTAPPRTQRWARLATGMFPGLRLMATESVQSGAAFAVLGMATLGMAIVMATRWEVFGETLRRIHGRHELQLFQAAGILALVVAFELLRLASCTAERQKSPARILAVVWLPSLLVVLSAPATGPLRPQLVEPMVAAAAVLAWGSSLPAVVSILDVILPVGAARRRVEQVGLWVYVGCTGLGLAYLFLWPHPTWAISLRKMGLSVLSSWFG